MLENTYNNNSDGLHKDYNKTTTKLQQPKT